MNKMVSYVKICAFVFLMIAINSGCKKDEDQYAYLKTSIEKYVVDSKVNSSILHTANGEKALIDEWLAAMAVNNQVVKTATGINYIVEKVGTGETVKTGKEVTVKYIGFYTNGDIFDASDYHGGTMTYVHKVDNLIKGWEEGIEVLQKGGRAAFLIPSAKGYGSNGTSSIPPYSPLIFVIEVVDIK
jgi:FKBP-type peptidyl-prolyl cis-trans isomerase FkpA